MAKPFKPYTVVRSRKGKRIMVAYKNGKRVSEKVAVMGFRKKNGQTGTMMIETTTTWNTRSGNEKIRALNATGSRSARKKNIIKRWDKSRLAASEMAERKRKAARKKKG